MASIPELLNTHIEAGGEDMGSLNGVLWTLMQRTKALEERTRDDDARTTAILTELRAVAAKVDALGTGG